MLPEGIVSTGWPAVAGKARELGLSVDPWQDGAGRCILAKRADGLYAAGIGGAVMSIPRQVGKTYLVGLIVFCLCLLHPNLTVIWTAHQLKTAGETFRAMQGFAKRRTIAPHVLRPRIGSGDWEIPFRNGSRILFGARERGFGLGFAMVDVLVLDEAQRLTDRTMDDMVPTMNAAPNPLMFMMGTPPRPTDAGEVFRSRRAEALSGDEPDRLYIEFSADLGGKDPYSWKPGYVDWDLVKQANPSFPDRTPRAAILRMRKNLGPASFVLEGLGVWDSPQSESLFDLSVWEEMRDRESVILGGATFVLDVAPNRGRATIVAAGANPYGRTHVEITSRAGVVDSRPGIDWLLPRLKELAEKDSAFTVHMVAGSAAESLRAPLEKAGIFVELVSRRDYAVACGWWMDAYAGRMVAHLGQPDFEAALAAVVKRDTAESQFEWARKLSTGDITTVVAATVAGWLAANQSGGTVF